MSLFTFYIAIAFMMLIVWVGIVLKAALHQANDPKKNKHSATSIVMAAHNEGRNLTAFLPNILSQLSAGDELVVIDDHSTDDTMSVLEGFATQNDRLKVLRSKHEIAGKKQALQQAIETAKNDVLLFTDADCAVGARWLESMNTAVQASDICLGYGGYLKEKGWVNALVRFETVTTAGQYFGMALWKNPYMGVGRNLMYRKSVFDRVGGFKSHDDLRSGDDDLLVQEAMSFAEVGINLDPESFTYSAAPTSWPSLFRQKARHVSTASRYHFGHKVWLGLLGVSNLLFYPLSAYLLVCSPTVFLWLIIGSVVLVKWSIFADWSRRMNERDLIVKFMVLDILFCIYLWVLSPYLFIKKRTWN